MSAVLNSNVNSNSIGTSVGASIIVHVVLVAFCLIAIKHADIYDSNTSALERSSVTLNFKKPAPVFEKKPLEKMVRPEKEVPVLRETKIAKPIPKTNWVEEPVVNEIKKEEPIKEVVIETNDAPVKEVANNTVIQDATFKGRRVAPKYPERAQMLGLEGTVVIKALIDVDGDIEDVEVLESSGYRILDKAVTKVAWKWEFEPSYVNGVPTKQWVKAPYQFVIR